MAQPRKMAEYDRPTSTAESTAAPNRPKKVEAYDRPTRAVSPAGLAIAVIMLIVLVILAILFLR